jgi:hypothetical protein
VVIITMQKADIASLGETLDRETVFVAPTKFRETIRSLRRHRSAMVGFTLLVFLISIAILAPVLSKYDPTKPLIGIENVKKRASPCIHALGCPTDQPEHYFGTDGNVRDEFVRVLYGARLSLIIGFTTVTFAIIVGTLLGLLAGFSSGGADNIIMRVMDVLLAFEFAPGDRYRHGLGAGVDQCSLAIGIVSILIYARGACQRDGGQADGFCRRFTGDGASKYHLMLRRSCPPATNHRCGDRITTAILDAAAYRLIGAQPPVLSGIDGRAGIKISSTPPI